LNWCCQFFLDSQRDEWAENNPTIEIDTLHLSFKEELEEEVPYLSDEDSFQSFPMDSVMSIKPQRVVDRKSNLNPELPEEGTDLRPKSLRATSVDKIRTNTYKCPHEGCGRILNHRSRTYPYRVHTGEKPFKCHEKG